MYQTQITRLLIVVVLLDICAMVGCHRSYYRRAADAEAKRLILEKANDPRWGSADGTIKIDPYSRMFNPFSADHPPLPPDDATSHQLMHNVDGKQGYPQWHANGDTDYVENPDWKAYLPSNQNGELVLTLDRAYQLALLHSTELQQQTETLYLSALDVSLERFGFDTQLFSGFNSFLTTRGRLRGGSGRSSTELSSGLGANGQGIRMTRLGATGANFAVGIANTILFNFSGNNNQSATSLIDFSLIQPLMRGAGRDRIMESLTQTERTLLANVRQMDRFRRGFYLQVATGRSPGAGPNRNGNFLALPNGATIGVGGFYGLLLQQQQIRNQEFNVRQLESVLEQFREFFARDRLDAVQLKLFESTVYGQQAALVEARIRYQTAVDLFKRTIGLPPDLEVVIEDEFLDRFNLISDEVNDRLNEIASLRERSGKALSAVVDLLPTRERDSDVIDFRWSDELGKRIAALGPFMAEAQRTLTRIKDDDVQQLLGDLRKLDSVRADRIEYLEKLVAAIDAGDVISSVDPAMYLPESIPKSSDLRRALDDPNNKDNILIRIDRIHDEIATAQKLIAEIENKQATLKGDELLDTIKEGIQDEVPELLSGINNTLLELSLLQAQARSNSIEMYDVQIDAEMATEVARCMRRDWMNARASLVDNWRRIEFVADQLESQVDLVFQGDIGNVGDNPFKLRYETGQLRAGFRFDSPLVRLSERNQYRQTLIQYQQSRRQFYQFEDEVKRNLRDIVRNLNRDKVLFELNRRSVLVQIEQIELNRLALQEPTPLNAVSTQFGGSTARNLADAFNNLNNFQNRFLGTWVEYEVLRRSLDFDMGTMQLDEMGAWIDPGLIDNTIGARAAAAMGIELDCQFCRDDVINPVVIQRVIPPTGSAPETIEAPAPPQPRPRDRNETINIQSNSNSALIFDPDAGSALISNPNQNSPRPLQPSAPAVKPSVPEVKPTTQPTIQPRELEIQQPLRPGNEGTQFETPVQPGFETSSKSHSLLPSTEPKSLAKTADIKTADIKTVDIKTAETKTISKQLTPPSVLNEITFVLPPAPRPTEALNFQQPVQRSGITMAGQHQSVIIPTVAEVRPVVNFADIGEPVLTARIPINSSDEKKPTTDWPANFQSFSDGFRRFGVDK